MCLESPTILMICWGGGTWDDDEGASLFGSDEEDEEDQRSHPAMSEEEDLRPQGAEVLPVKRGAVANDETLSIITPII